jgi:hypothetical protein
MLVPLVAVKNGHARSPSRRGDPSGGFRRTRVASLRFRQQAGHSPKARRRGLHVPAGRQGQARRPKDAQAYTLTCYASGVDGSVDLTPSRCAHSSHGARRQRQGDEHILAFAVALPAIRAWVKKPMALPGLRREQLLAAVVHLLETTLIRIGSDDYAKQNASYGLTTQESARLC